MANLCKHVTVSVLVLMLSISNCFSEEVTAESVYKQLSQSISELKNEMENIHRQTVEHFEFKFAEFKSEILKDIASINASLEVRTEEMFDIVNSSSSDLAKGIAELTSNLSYATDNMTRFLETMEVTMMSNFEDIETRMIANVTKMQSK
jgi:hypothetical protein